MVSDLRVLDQSALLPINGVNREGLALAGFQASSLCILSLTHFQMEQSQVRPCTPPLSSWCDTPFGPTVWGLARMLTWASCSPVSFWNDSVSWHGLWCTTSCGLCGTGAVCVSQMVHATHSGVCLHRADSWDCFRNLDLLFVSSLTWHEICGETVIGSSPNTIKQQLEYKWWLEGWQANRRQTLSE